MNLYTKQKQIFYNKLQGKKSEKEYIYIYTHTHTLTYKHAHKCIRITESLSCTTETNTTL